MSLLEAVAQEQPLSLTLGCWYVTLHVNDSHALIFQTQHTHSCKRQPLEQPFPTVGQTDEEIGSSAICNGPLFFSPNLRPLPKRLQEELGAAGPRGGSAVAGRLHAINESAYTNYRRCREVVKDVEDMARVKATMDGQVIGP